MKRSFEKVGIGLLLILLSFSINGINAQQDEQLSMYNFNPLYYNPAYAGSKEGISIAALGRFQWLNFEGAPNTQFLSMHLPVMGQNLGAGFSLVNDKIGARRRTAVYLDASTGIQLNHKNDRLAFGLALGIDNLSFDFSELSVIETNDEYYNNAVSATKFNVGGGIYYYNEKYYIGVSSPRLLVASTKDKNNVEMNLNKRHFFLTGGYVFDINSVVKLKPTTLIKFTPNAPLTFDINLNFLLYERVWIGGLYRFHEAVGLNFVYNFNSVFYLGYGYDFPINRLMKYQAGSHEVMLRVDIKSKKNTIFSPRYF